ncbi:hypothetical protein [Roseicyclus marinus]|uniref:hypothetical protein n=1 Tax=Roseicyclus marinus TaxID=2161673 RepID=UPI00240F835F|nr:hypothetical protein [Roseicyclus marinus]MDG3041991.1 hypothetical protein [Roseicyclus marinus]
MRRGALIGLLGLLSLAVGLWELSGRGPINPALAPASAAAEDIAATTAGVYVSLRIINAALSTAQEIEVGASVGAQATVQPLKVLEPVDDTVERVAGVVFAVAVGAALATVGFAPVAALGLCLFGVGALFRAVDDLLPVIDGLRVSSAYAMRLGAVLAIVVPLGFAGGVAMGERITAPQWEAAIAALDAVTTEARVLTGAGEEMPAGGTSVPITAADAGLFARLGAQLQAAGDGMGEAVAAVGRYREAAVVLMSQADELFRASLTIIGIFALRTLVLPALLLWGALALMRRSAGAG